MRRFLRGVWRVIKGLPLAILSPILVFIAAASLLFCDLYCRLRGKTPLPADTKPDTRAASIVIPNWNGRDLLAKYLPSVLAAAEQRRGSEVIVVDNGSTDGSARIRAGELSRACGWSRCRENLGFGGGSNAGFESRAYDIVVLLNSDMRVERDFLSAAARRASRTKKSSPSPARFSSPIRTRCAKRPG